jgi:hypothetical protein
MKASELRIGNLVYYNGVATKVSSTIINMFFHGKFLKGIISPIELTEEWLLRMGFGKKESSTCVRWYIGHNEITKDWLFDLVWLEKPEAINAPNAPFYRNGRFTLYYVHQLQNLYFALTGEELTT